jgi:hypothetical protein
VNEIARRLRELSLPEAVGLTGVAMAVAGVAITADALVRAAQDTAGAALLDWYQRLLLGLWSFRVEETLWFTAGLLLLWWALANGCRLGGWALPASRLAGGVAVGFALVAVAVILASTWVALTGHLGSGLSEVRFTGRERAFTWLRQVTTALAGGLVWAILAARLPDAEGQLPAARPAQQDPDEEPEHDRQPLSVAPQPIPFQPAPEQPQPEPELEAPLPDRLRPAPAPVAVPDPDPEPVAADGSEASPAARARRDYHDRLAYSPRRDEARALVERIAELEQAGDTAEAEQLVAQLSDL